MTYVRAVEQERFVRRQVTRLAIGLLLLCLALVVALLQSLRTVRVDIRPGLATRTVIRAGDVPDENVYSFALVVFQQLNRWRDDGAKDYTEQIKRTRAFFTDRYRAQLFRDADTRRMAGELQFRTRSVAPPPELTFRRDRVKRVSDSLWIVFLDLELQETVRGQVVKAPIIRYPLRIVSYDNDSEFNPYGLLIDGFSEDPRRLSTDELKQMGIDRKEGI